MGLYRSRFRFEGALPDLEAVREEAHRRLGNTYGVENLVVEGQIVEVYSMLDPYTDPVMCAILQEMGGRAVGSDGQLVVRSVPDWAHRPLHEMTWRERMAIAWPWWAWLFGTAKPRRP